MSRYCRHNRVAGRCPDCPTAAELIRQDLSPTMAQLFVIYDSYGRFEDAPNVYRYDTFERYMDQLYGDRRWDPFMALNYGLLASIVALIVALTWLILSG